MDSQDTHCKYTGLADLIMNSSTCLACHTRYPHKDSTIACPNCGRTHKEQVECMGELTDPHIRGVDKMEQVPSLTVRVLNSKGLGVEGRWSAVISSVNSGETWYRAFHYKADAEYLLLEILKMPRMTTLHRVLDYYGIHYWTPLK